MDAHGWTNDHTWGVAGACDNTATFADALATIVSAARGDGDVSGAAAQLREAVQSRGALATTLPSWVDLGAVDWAELVSTWARDAA